MEISNFTTKLYKNSVKCLIFQFIWMNYNPTLFIALDILIDFKTTIVMTKNLSRYSTWGSKVATIPGSIQIFAFQNATNDLIKVLDFDSLDTFRLRFQNMFIKIFLWHYFLNNYCI